MQNKPVALVTGANQGIGLQIAKDLAAHGFTVLVGSRNSSEERQRPRASERTPTPSSSTSRIRLPSPPRQSASGTSSAASTCSSTTRPSRIRDGKPGETVQEIAKSGRPSVASLDEVRAVFETNVFGVIAVTQAMLPLLREAPAARIVNVSSAAARSR